MCTLHLIGDDDMYRNLAFLLSEQCTHMIKPAVFEGSKKSVFKDCRELSGSLLEQLEEAFDYIERYNRTRAEFSGLDHYYQEPYQDEDDEIKEMRKLIETDESKKIRSLDLVNED